MFWIKTREFVVFTETLLFDVRNDIQGCELFGFIPINQLVVCMLEQEILLDFLVLELCLVAARQVHRSQEGVVGELANVC